MTESDVTVHAIFCIILVYSIHVSALVFILITFTIIHQLWTGSGSFISDFDSDNCRFIPVPMPIPDRIFMFIG